MQKGTNVLSLEQTISLRLYFEKFIIKVKAFVLSLYEEMDSFYFDDNKKLFIEQRQIYITYKLQVEIIISQSTVK